MASRFNLGKIQLSRIQMLNDSRCVSAYDILNDLYYSTRVLFHHLNSPFIQKDLQIIRLQQCTKEICIFIIQ